MKSRKKWIVLVSLTINCLATLNGIGGPSQDGFNYPEVKAGQHTTDSQGKKAETATNLDLFTQTIFEGAPTKQEGDDTQATPSDKQNESGATLDRLSLIFNGVLALVGVIYTVFAGLQWSAIREQLREMKKSTDAVTHGLEISRRGIHLDKRAWVVFGVVSGKPVANEKLIVHVIAKNTGSTPALKLRVNVYHQVVPRGKEPDFSLDARIATATRFSEGVLGAGRELENEVHVCFGEVNDSQTVTQGDISEFKKSVFFVIGNLTYEDIFGVRHWATMCSFLEHPHGEYGTYKSHNECDLEGTSLVET